MSDHAVTPGSSWKPRKIHLYIPDNERAQRIGDRLQRMLETAGLPVSPQVEDSDDLVLALGGDGTFLEAVHRYHEIGPVFCGVNAGNLGFLHEINEDNLVQAVDRLLKGQTAIEEHHLMSVEIVNEDQNSTRTVQAFNDLVVERHATRALRLSLKIDDHDLGTIVADGILITSPAGSTGYAMAARGAIVHPSCNVLQIVPLHPHSSRISFSLDLPLIVPPDAAIEIQFAWSSVRQPRLVVDGEQVPLGKGDSVRARRSTDKVRILRLGIADFWDRLREKFR